MIVCILAVAILPYLHLEHVPRLQHDAPRRSSHGVRWMGEANPDLNEEDDILLMIWANFGFLGLFFFPLLGCFLLGHAPSPHIPDGLGPCAQAVNLGILASTIGRWLTCSIQVYVDLDGDHACDCFKSKSVRLSSVHKFMWAA